MGDPTPLQIRCRGLLGEDPYGVRTPAGVRLAELTRKGPLQALWGWQEPASEDSGSEVQWRRGSLDRAPGQNSEGLCAARSAGAAPEVLGRPLRLQEAVWSSKCFPGPGDSHFSGVAVFSAPEARPCLRNF